MSRFLYDYSTLLYLCAGITFVVLITLSSRPRRRYPPGPKGLPIVGNLFDVPTDHGWKRYQEIGKEYGSDIVHFQVFGSHIVVVNTAKAARELLDKRSNIYSDKQRSVMIHELTGWHRNFSLMPYGEGWRTRRRLFHQHFRPMAVPQYHTRQLKAVHGLVQSLFEAPQNYKEHIRFMAGSAILDIIFAFDIQPGDPRIEIVEKGVQTATEFMCSGVYLVDVFPILKYLPSWFPGAGFKRQAAKWKALVDDMHEIPYYQFKQTMREGKAKPCFASTLLSSAAENDKDSLESLDEIFMSLTGTAYVAGSDTTISALNTFVLAMTMFPETQAAAQEELDRVLGRKRLPDFDDRDSMPYLTAMVYELLRWHSVLPLGLPHRTLADDEYNGYFIPAGTVIVGNCWGMLHDDDLFPDPDIFRPERFLNADGTLNSDAHFPIETFGFGRRICPGRYFAQDLLWLTIANVLAACSIERVVDEKGFEVRPTGDMTPRVLSMPEPFECNIRPRFSGAEALVRSACLND
uniref:PAH-inducible cytochrome P450 monooxygenase PC-PAH 3 n=1 Tax=Phanerodontia chrysosporium TaxID=2822231 RepID=A9JR51_PHACH|nr:PAH-inducible cytochrome P450 monooxygenase PC-PAH 3 [Phanerodontia chrysosporium]